MLMWSRSVRRDEITQQVLCKHGIDCRATWDRAYRMSIPDEVWEAYMLELNALLALEGV